MDHDSETRGKRLTRAEARNQTRERLLAAAERVFARNGFAGASVEEIAEAAGYSTGALYSNFGGKQEILTEVLTRRAASRIEAAARIADDGIAGTADPLEASGRLLADVADNDRDFALLQAESWLYAVQNPEAMTVLAARRQELAAAAERLVAAELDRRGTPASVPLAPGVTTVVLALFDGLVRQRRTDPVSVPDGLFPQALRWLIAGLTASEPAPTQEPSQPQARKPSAGNP
jgi:AcrR family transcriptional regulator